MENSYPLALAFHKVGGPVELGVGRVSAHTFSKQMRTVKEMGFETVLPSPLDGSSGCLSNTIILTFDDGYESLFESAVPTLLELGIAATFFCVAGYLGRSNTWDTRQGRRQRHLSSGQLRELSGLGFEIGSHGLRHRLLTRLPIEEARMELIESKTILEDATGEAVGCLSYPFGRSNEQVMSLAEDAGYHSAFGMGCSPVPSGFSRTRTPVYLYDGVSGFRAKLTESSGRGRELSDGLVSLLSLGTTLWHRVTPNAME